MSRNITRSITTTLASIVTTTLESTEDLPAPEFTNINCPDIRSQVAYGILNISGFFLNVVVFIVVWKKTNASLRPYSRVLLTSAGIDIYSSLFQFLTQARPAFIGKNYVYTFSMDGILPSLLQNTELFAGGKLNYLLIPEYIGCYFSVCYSCVPFIYRYLIICWDHHMNRLEFGFLCLILFCLSLFCSVVINYPSAEIYDYNMKLVPTPNPNCTRFLPQFGPSNNRAETKLLQVFQLWHYGTLFILATYLITIACFINIQIFLYQKRHNSDTHLKIQKQLTWTLGLQALCPLVAFYGPQTAFIVLGFFNISFMFTYEILFISYAIIPVFNGFIVFLLIAHYRSAFFTLASQMGHQILTSIRLQRYATSKPANQPLFVQPAARPERNFEVMSRAF